jgi:hypothetical protein
VDHPGVGVRRARLRVGLSLVFTLTAPACAESGGGRAAPPTTGSAAPYVVSIQGGYASDEQFCALAPLSGSVRYSTRQGSATFELDVGGLPPQSLIAIDWINNAVRGYTVAAFDTDGNGQSETSSLRMFRPGEAKAIGLHLTTTNIASPVLGQLRPC